MSGNTYTPVTYYSGCQDGNASPVHSQNGEPKSVQVLDISQPLSYEPFITNDARHHYMRHIDPVYPILRKDDSRIERKSWDFDPTALEREVKPMVCSPNNAIKIEPERYERADMDNSWVNGLELTKLHYDSSLASRNDSRLSMNTIPVSPYLQVAERFVNELSEHKDSFVHSPVDSSSHTSVEMNNLLPSSVISAEQGGLAEDISVSPKTVQEQRSVLEEEGSSLTSNSYPISIYPGVSTPPVNSEASVITINVQSRSTNIHQLNAFGQDSSQDLSSNSSTPSVQETLVERFACNSCDKEFVTRNKLSMHKRAHRKKQKTHPKIINEAMGSGEFLREDSASSHEQKLSSENDGETSFICSTCGRGFRLKMALACHMRYHAEERTYTCTDCNQTFSSRWVRSPQLCDKCRHGPGAKPVPKPCRCERCGKCFKDARLLRDHTRSHTGERPFACQVCGKTFAQSGTLYRHKQVHSDSRPYRCTQCNKSYKLKGHLTVHIKSHSI